MNVVRVWIIFIFLLLFWQAYALAQSADNIVVSGGMASTQISGLKSVSVSSSSGIQAGWLHFPTTRYGVLVEYHIYQNSVLKRIGYQAVRLGTIYFPFSVSVPLSSNPFPGLSYTIDSTYRPYVGGGVSSGRILIGTFGDVDVFDVSSEFVGAFASFGSQVSLTSFMSGDARLTIEPAMGIGVASMTALSIFIQLGLAFQL